MHRELVIDFSDLLDMVIPCGKCETRVHIKIGEQDSRIPRECPSCGTEYDDAFREALREFRQIYRRLADPKGRTVQFRIATLDGPR